MAAAGRHKAADIVDLVTIQHTVLPLGPVIWAAVEKAPGFTPEGLLAEIRRNAHYRDEELRSVPTLEPLESKSFYPRLWKILSEAEAFVVRMPTDKVGVLFLKDSQVVQPDPDRLHEYTTHAGQRRGHWPSSPEIASAMLERYRP